MSIFLRKDIYTGEERNLFSDVDNYVTFGAVDWQSKMRNDFMNAGVPIIAGIYVGSAVAVVGAVALDAGAIAAGASVVVKLKNGATVSAKLIKSSVSCAFANANADSTILAEMAKGALAILQATTSSGRKYVIPY